MTQFIRFQDIEGSNVLMSLEYIIAIKTDGVNINLHHLTGNGEDFYILPISMQCFESQIENGKSDFIIRISNASKEDDALLTGPDITIEPPAKLIRVEGFNNTHNTPSADGANLLRQIKKVFYGEQGEVKHHIPECNINRLEFYDDETMKFIAFHGEYPAIYVESIEKVLSKLRTLKNTNYHISLTIQEDGDCFLTQDAAGMEMIARDRSEEDEELIIEERINS